MASLQLKVSVRGGEIAPRILYKYTGFFGRSVHCCRASSLSIDRHDGFSGAIQVRRGMRVGVREFAVIRSQRVADSFAITARCEFPGEQSFAAYIRRLLPCSSCRARGRPGSDGRCGHSSDARTRRHVKIQSFHQLAALARGLSTALQTKSGDNFIPRRERQQQPVWRSHCNKAVASTCS